MHALDRTVPSSGRKPPARGLLAAYALACIGFLYFVAFEHPIHRGDGFEYLLVVEAFANHGSPNLHAADLAELQIELPRNGLPSHPHMDMNFYEARGGLRLGWHFWLYPMLAAPFHKGLEFIAANPLAALQCLNAFSLCVAVGIALFTRGPPLGERLPFLGLALVSPVWWFLFWPHPEVFTWSCSMASIALFRAGSRTPAVLFAVLGAMQNPPVAFLAGGLVVLTTLEDGARRATLPLAAASLAMLPALFSLWAFGTPSLIVSRGIAGWQFASWERAASLVFDLNQGMLPYIPPLLALALLTSFSAMATRRGRPLILTAVLVAMIAVASTQGNWNGGTAGIMRYAIWMIPVMAWLVVDYLPQFRGRTLVITLAIAAELPILLSRGGEQDYVDHSPVAAWALVHAPSLYSPVPEIFIERTIHREANAPGALESLLPVAYARPDGVVTKIAYRLPINEADWKELAVQEAYLERLSREAPTSSGIRYLEPPEGSVQLRTPVYPE